MVSDANAIEILASGDNVMGKLALAEVITNANDSWWYLMVPDANADANGRLASGANAMAKLALAVVRTNANGSWWYSMVFNGTLISFDVNW
jgi:hypothetical protein